MRSYTIYNRRIVRTTSSRHGRRLLANLRKTQRALTQQHGERPDADLVAKTLHVGVRDVEEMEAALSKREQDILRHRYLGKESRSLASIGRGMGLSRERVRQLEHQAQAKMRHAILDESA